MYRNDMGSRLVKIACPLYPSADTLIQINFVVHDGKYWFLPNIGVCDHGSGNPACNLCLSSLYTFLIEDCTYQLNIPSPFYLPKKP